VTSNLRPAFYALSVGSWRDYVTLLHPPYTIWHLSYVLLGAAAAPAVHPERVAGTVLAFFLGVGLAAHAFDEYKGRPLKTRIPDALLLGIAVFSLIGALAIGLVAIFTISLWTIPFVLFGEFAVLAYNLELWKGRFHSDVWFGVAWGAFPALTGYWANAGRLSIEAFLVAGACLTLSLAQRVLSTRVRTLRRKARNAQGRIEYQDGSVENIDLGYLISPSEAALRLMTWSVGLLALGWLLGRFLG